MSRGASKRICCPNPKVEDIDGQQTCTSCGAVHSESHMVSELSFGESSSGAAVLHGSFVGEGQTHARTTGLRRGVVTGGGAAESREAALLAARDEMNRCAAALNLPPVYAETGMRWFKLAVTHNFLKGRRISYVVAACLYTVCREHGSHYMLIDFSDYLRINVFLLGQTFIKFLRVVNKTNLDPVDPSLYVHRFARGLDFGKDTTKIATDALRIIQRMKRDWISQGRRPSGICGACLILAARMNGHVRTVRDVMYVVKVADITIQKRLDEFKSTQSSQLTVEQFRSIWLERSHDPPSFGPKKKRKRGLNEALLGDGAPNEPDIPIDPELIAAQSLDSHALSLMPPAPADPLSPPSSHSPGARHSPDDTAEEAITNEINSELGSCQSFLTPEILAELNEARRVEQERQLRESNPGSPSSMHTVDPQLLDDVDDDFDVQNALLSQKESETKEKVWMEANADYLELQEEKRKKREMDEKNGVVKPTRKRRKGPNHAQLVKAGIIQPGDSNGSLTESIPASPAESAKMLLMKRGFSSKINYKALDHLFDD
ncbi:BRF1-domain-containing protein [Ascobolus immersus RN42]|uniref:B-related factor 1 n=1 Tax=Ascobolus immersus RN42 TaxID=1160509 RepID=A0A3N4IKW4_ASCIM|nr:BRF1-domain-containing protein [Ascobolus immersus RN42]